jgi:hypothetical protein
VFDTAIVTEIHHTEYVELTDVGGVSSCKTAQYSTLNSVQQDYSVGDAFWGAIPINIVVFDTAIVTEINQTEYGKLTDVGSIDGQARSQNITQSLILQV